MKNDKVLSNVKLGVLVIAGFLFLVFSLYMIGKNQNIFGSSFLVHAKIDHVNGLVPGNNVRFQGLEVGTVKSLEMKNDSTIVMTMLIRKSMQSFIRKNSKITINTDGLMGNKIVQIHPQPGESGPIEEGDVLLSLKQIGTEEMIEKLSSTGEYLELTLVNLASITERLNKSEGIWQILADPELAMDLKGAVRELHRAGLNASAMAKSGRDLMSTLESGDGIVKSIFTDSLMNQNLVRSVEQLNQTTTDAARVMENLNTLLGNIEKGQGTAGLILSDSAFREQLVQTMENVEQSTEKLNQNMEAMKSNFLFRGYFKKQEKAQMKYEKDSVKNLK
jgi:phospholipid/cholesterol/gamma-HCH transport system substrate-binding protein